jgi:pimeloyl-ACP methyl ester carboxylesterase
MIRIPGCFLLWVVCGFFCDGVLGQNAPYDQFPAAKPPYYRVRYAAETVEGGLQFPVNYTIWIPPQVERLRGVVVHQHGCGEGSCKSGLTGAFDLHWQALAKKHECALLAPAYEQPQEANCQLWCDPRNGSAAAFHRALIDLGEKSNHPELPDVPWALWGHSGGGHWAGGMTLMYPQRVAAAWLRSGVPFLAEDSDRPAIQPHELPNDALTVPIMCNLGTQEGVTVKEGRFAGVWPSNEKFFTAIRSKGGLIGVAVDPLTSHECGNQRYMAIPWLDACLSARLPGTAGSPLRKMPAEDVWLALPTGFQAYPMNDFPGEPLEAAWLPNPSIAKRWQEYVKDTQVTDETPPPAPTKVTLEGNRLSWQAEADLESGIARFLIYRDGKLLARVPDSPKNPYGRPLFHNLLYSDTPVQPLAMMVYDDMTQQKGTKHTYQVVTENTRGATSEMSEEASPK